MSEDLSRKTPKGIEKVPDKMEEMAKVLKMFALREGIITKGFDLKGYLKGRPEVKLSSATVLREMRGT
ncbi:MAG: hypothetical protein GXO65_04380 [Euryarchaeota archaeon]|nr:hypothetical protein [Euryarchaeota archaeon]